MPSRKRHRRSMAKLRSYRRWQGWTHAYKVVAVLRMVGEDYQKAHVREWMTYSNTRKKDTFGVLQAWYDKRRKTQPPEWVRDLEKHIEKESTR